MYHSLPSVSKGHMLNRKNQTLGLSHIHRERTLHYIVVFKTDKMARKVQYTMHPDPIMRIERENFMDITEDVTNGLSQMGLDHLVQGNISIDVSSRLYIPKSTEPGGVSNPMNDGGFHLASSPMEDLFMYPFEKNIGLIMPYDVSWEDNKQIVLTCQVLDPVESTFHFAKNLVI